MSGVPCRKQHETCPHDVPHGSNSTYVNHACRCDDCVEAHRQAKNAMQADRVRRLETGDVVVPHGRFSTYTNYGCRCDECKDASRNHWRRWRHGTARILVGLVLVAGSALGAFGHDARTSEPREAWLCTLDQPHCVAAMEADRG